MLYKRFTYFAFFFCQCKLNGSENTFSQMEEINGGFHSQLLFD